MLGLIVLPCTLLCGHLIGIAAISTQAGFARMPPPLRALAELSVTMCAVAAVFWAWASYKLLARHDPDLGTVSFLIALVAAYRTADLATVQSSGRKGSGNVVQQMRCYLPAAAFVVAANYGLVLPFIIGRLPGAFVCYLGLGAATWLTLGIRAIRLFSSLEASAQARLLDEQEGMSEEG